MSIKGLFCAFQRDQAVLVELLFTSDFSRHFVWLHYVCFMFSDCTCCVPRPNVLRIAVSVGSKEAKDNSSALQLSALGMAPVILLASFYAYQQLYPFLCTPCMVVLAQERRTLTIYPLEILQGAPYQGSAVQEQDYCIIKSLLSAYKEQPFSQKITSWQDISLSPMGPCDCGIPQVFHLTSPWVTLIWRLPSYRYQVTWSGVPWSHDLEVTQHRGLWAGEDTRVHNHQGVYPIIY